MELKAQNYKLAATKNSLEESGSSKDWTNSFTTTFKSDNKDSNSQGSFVNDDEVQKIAKSLRDNGKPDYVQDVTKSLEAVQNNSESNEDDDLYDQAVEFVVESRRASISSIQRKFRIGYNRAARLIETMEENGIVSPMNSNGSREVL